MSPPRPRPGSPALELPQLPVKALHLSRGRRRRRAVRLQLRLQLRQLGAGLRVVVLKRGRKDDFGILGGGGGAGPRGGGGSDHPRPAALHCRTSGAPRPIVRTLPPVTHPPREHTPPLACPAAAPPAPARPPCPRWRPPGRPSAAHTPGCCGRGRSARWRCGKPFGHGARGPMQEARGLMRHGAEARGGAWARGAWRLARGGAAATVAVTAAPARALVASSWRACASRRCAARCLSSYSRMDLTPAFLRDPGGVTRGRGGRGGASRRVLGSPLAQAHRESPLPESCPALPQKHALVTTANDKKTAHLEKAANMRSLISLMRLVMRSSSRCECVGGGGRPLMGLGGLEKSAGRAREAERCAALPATARARREGAQLGCTLRWRWRYFPPHLPVGGGLLQRLHLGCLGLALLGACGGGRSGSSGCNGVGRRAAVRRTPGGRSVEGGAGAGTGRHGSAAWRAAGRAAPASEPPPRPGTP